MRVFQNPPDIVDWASDHIVCLEGAQNLASAALANPPRYHGIQDLGVLHAARVVAKALIRTEIRLPDRPGQSLKHSLGSGRDDHPLTVYGLVGIAWGVLLHP